MGIKATDIFDYDGHEITIRPLSSYELDNAEKEGYKYVTSNLAKLIMRIRLKDVSLTKMLGKIPPEMFTAINKYYKEVDYWIIYYSMKDFQPEDFSINDVRKMRYVHDIALKVINMSSAGDRKLVEIINTADGRRLGKIIFDFHVPITDEAWKMTPLQYKYCDLINNGVKKIYNEEEFEKMVHGSVLPKAVKKLVGK